MSRRWATSLAALGVVLAACVPAGGSDSHLIEGCSRQHLGGRSVARVWDEALLDAIRRDVPAPTVHARNLFHTSAAMWDAWAAYDPRAEGFFVDEKHEAEDVRAAREAAISYAAYRLLLYRYSHAAGLEATFDELAHTMRSLCYRIDVITTHGDSPAAVGNRVAAAAIAFGERDDALEETRYVDSAYRPVNEPLVVGGDEIAMRDPNRWQPLALERFVAQNGLPVPGSVQRFIGSQWGHVRGFALPPSPRGMPIDPGPPPQGGGTTDDAFKRAAIRVLRSSSQLDPADGIEVDISPGALGDNALGANDGDGHEVNPVTGEPYAPNVVPRGDWGRVLAQFWADGPNSETPPGHWNTIANDVTETPGFERRLGGEGPELDPLEWDVKMYLALNGAVHDAAVAAWGVKRSYDSVRPISMIRYMGSLGQSSDPDGDSYHPGGLPLVPGLVEVVTEASSARGRRHDHLAAHVGEITVRTWRGTPADPATETAGVGWILATRWLPYQLPTFVTPAFAGYVSGHSTFSRAAAEVLARLTGAEYFPGGLAEWAIPAGALEPDHGPTSAVTLQAATYYDAADQAGISRLFGGIHIAEDDLEGRKIGAICGRDAWALALTYFDGTAA